MRSQAGRGSLGTTDQGTVGRVAGVHRNELLARRDVELASQGDIEGLRGLYTDDCVFHYLGKNPLAGAHRGLSAFLSRLEEVFKGATITRPAHRRRGKRYAVHTHEPIRRGDAVGLS